MPAAYPLNTMQTGKTGLMRSFHGNTFQQGFIHGFLEKELKFSENEKVIGDCRLGDCFYCGVCDKGRMKGDNRDAIGVSPKTYQPSSLKMALDAAPSAKKRGCHLRFG